MDESKNMPQRLRAIQRSHVHSEFTMIMIPKRSTGTPDQTIESQIQSIEAEKGQVQPVQPVILSSDPSCTVLKCCCLPIGVRIDGGSDTNDTLVTNSTSAPKDYMSIPTPNHQQSANVSLGGTEFCQNITTTMCPGTFYRKTSASMERQDSRGKRHKIKVQFQGSHPFIPGKVRHKHPGEVHRKNYTQYVYSHTNTDHRMSHHYLCRTDDLEKPVYYYHDVGGYTRLDPDHMFTLHLGNHEGTPILGAMWHTSSGMNFAVGNPNMDFKDRDNESVKTIQRQYCDYLKPISSAPTRWHMDFTFGGGAGEGPKLAYRWQVVHLAEAIPHLRHGKLELREKENHDLVNDKGKKFAKGKLLAACRNVDELSTNLWVRDASDEMGNELARIKWKTWVLLTWGAMRDRMQGPHNTGSSHHDVGYTKSNRTVRSPGGLCPLMGHTVGGCISPPRMEDIRERKLNGDEY